MRVGPARAISAWKVRWKQQERRHVPPPDGGGEVIEYNHLQTARQGRNFFPVNGEQTRDGTRRLSRSPSSASAATVGEVEPGGVEQSTSTRISTRQLGSVQDRKGVSTPASESWYDEELMETKGRQTVVRKPLKECENSSQVKTAVTSEYRWGPYSEKPVNLITGRASKAAEGPDVWRNATNEEWARKGIG